MQSVLAYFVALLEVFAISCQLQKGKIIKFKKASIGRVIDRRVLVQKLRHHIIIDHRESIGETISPSDHTLT